MKTPWREDPNLPPRWRAFGEALVAARPDWEPFVLGAVAAYHPGYGGDDVRFVVEIPSRHPTIDSPLVAEIADREYQGHIDVYWGEFFEHVIGRGIAQEAHFARAIDVLRGIVEEETLIVHRRNEVGRRTHQGRSPAPIERPLAEIGAEGGGTIAVWSWLGTYDEGWPSGADAHEGGA